MKKLLFAVLFCLIPFALFAQYPWDRSGGIKFKNIYLVDAWYYTVADSGETVKVHCKLQAKELIAGTVVSTDTTKTKYIEAPDTLIVLSITVFRDTVVHQTVTIENSVLKVDSMNANALGFIDFLADIDLGGVNIKDVDSVLGGLYCKFEEGLIDTAMGDSADYDKGRFDYLHSTHSYSDLADHDTVLADSFDADAGRIDMLHSNNIYADDTAFASVSVPVSGNAQYGSGSRIMAKCSTFTYGNDTLTQEHSPSLLPKKTFLHQVYIINKAKDDTLFIRWRDNDTCEVEVMGDGNLRIVGDLQLNGSLHPADTSHDNGRMANRWKTIWARQHIGTDVTGADSFYVEDDGTNVKLYGDNPPKIGNTQVVNISDVLQLPLHTLAPGDSIPGKIWYGSVGGDTAWWAGGYKNDRSDDSLTKFHDVTP